MSYRVMQGETEIGISPTIVHIYMGANGAYQECSEDEATGFCVKLPRIIEPINDDEELLEDTELEPTGEYLFDTVFSLPGKNLDGAVGEATYGVITPEQYEEITGEQYEG